MCPAVLENATDIRKNWSETVDRVVREKPVFAKRTRDTIMISDTHLISYLLTPYFFTAQEIYEDDGTLTLSLNELDLIANGPTKQEAISNLANDILEYSIEFYDEFDYWSSASNRQKHIPYILKAIILGNTKAIGDVIICQNGQN